MTDDELHRPSLGLIWAQARGGVIGHQGTMPWHLPEDLGRFRQLTMGSPVIMGRRTWESLPERFRPLPGRSNIVLSRQAGVVVEGAELASSFEEAYALAASLVAQDGTVWIIGGGELYREALPLADRIELTEVGLDVEGDTYAPELGPHWRQVLDEVSTDDWEVSSTGLGFRFVSLRRTYSDWPPPGAIPLPRR